MSAAEEEFARQLTGSAHHHEAAPEFIREHRFDRSKELCPSCGGAGLVPGKRKPMVKCKRSGCHDGKITVGKDWRFDFSWPEYKLAVEIEGGVFVRGRHSRGAGFTKDCVKYNSAALKGWRVLRFTTQHVQQGYALDTTLKMLEVMSARG